MIVSFYDPVEDRTYHRTLTSKNMMAVAKSLHKIHSLHEFSHLVGALKHALASGREKYELRCECADLQHDTPYSQTPNEKRYEKQNHDAACPDHDHPPGHCRLRIQDDKVNHPSHYGGDTIYEHVKVATALGWTNDALIYNCTKYLWRVGKKDGASVIEDLKKALWYLTERVRQEKNKKS